MQELDFSKIKNPFVLSPEYILSKIEESQIMLYYLGSFRMNKAFCSPFGGDSKPSARCFISTSGHILFQDFREKGFLNCWQVVKKIYNCNFHKALQIVATDFGLLDTKSKISQRFLEEAQALEKAVKKDTIIQFTTEPWSIKNSRFWRRGEITLEELNSAQDIFHIKDLYINHQQIFNPNNYHRYAYVVNCEINGKWEKRVKVYSPQDNKMKFLSSVPLSCPGNLNTLPFKDERCFIIKSKKDHLILSRYFTDMIWLMNESEQSLPENIVKYLKERYKRIILIFGSDPHATNASQIITKKYDLEYFNTYKKDYEQYQAEDPFDIVSIFGRKVLEQQLKEKNLI